MIVRLPRSTLFPYTTLCRSGRGIPEAMGREGAAAGVSHRLSGHRQPRSPADHAKAAPLTAALLLAVALSGMAPVGGRKAKASEVAAQPAAGPSAGAATQAGAKPTPGVTTESEAGGTHIRIETSS